MSNNHSLGLPKFRQNQYYFILTILLIFSFNLLINAQPEFSADELRLIREKNHISDGLKYHLPQDKFPMPEISNRNLTVVADGDLDTTFNASVTDGFGYVSKTVVQPDGKIIAVGLFQRANGVRMNGITRFNADGTLDPSFNTGAGANAAIRTVALQPDGKILVGGAFISFNNQAVRCIVRLNSDGSIDSSFSLTFVPNSQINDILVLPNGKIMVGGQSFSADSNLVRLNSDGTFDSAINNFNDIVFTIALAPDGKIVVGGFFSFPKPNVARLNSDGSLDPVFNPTSGSEDYPVFKVLVQPNGKVIASGAFRTFNGTATDAVVRLNDNGSVDSTFEITNDPTLTDLEADGLALQPDGKILVSFFDNATTALADVRRFNADASPDPTFNTNTGNSLTAVDLNLLADGKVLAAGFFTTLNNQQHLRLAKLNSDGTLDNTFNAQASSLGIVNAIKRQPDGKTLIGGDFEYVNGIRKSAIARLNADGSLDNSFAIDEGFYGDIFAIEIQSDGKVLVGGRFSGGTSLPAFAAARLNSDGSFDISLNNNNALIAVVYAFALQADGKILVGGLIADQNFRLIAATRLNSDGSSDGSFTPSLIPSGVARAIAVQPSGKIIIGGTFRPGGSPVVRTGILRLNDNGTLDSAFSHSAGNVHSLKQMPNGQIYAGGVTLRRFSSEGVVDPTLNIGSGFSGSINAVVVQPDGKILLGGFFTTYNGNAVGRITRISNTGAIDPTFNASAAGYVYALNLQPDGKILVGGQFLDFNGSEKFSLVRLQSLSAALHRAPFDFDGDGKTDLSIFRPSAGEWWYSRSSDGQVSAAQFGSGTDKLVPADFTGDGRADIAFWQPSTGYWFILRSEDGSFFSLPFGQSGDIPAPADYDADGRSDVAVFRPSSGTWFINKSSGGTDIVQFGANGDAPVTGDYEGDGRSDMAIFRPSTGEWWLRRSSGGVAVASFGSLSDKPVQGDYTGDGKTDIAFWRPSTGEWFILRSEDSSYFTIPFGANGDTPVAADYDGDGKFDFAVFRPSGATWYVNRSTAGLLIQQFGLSSDQPVPSAFTP